MVSCSSGPLGGLRDRSRRASLPAYSRSTVNTSHILDHESGGDGRQTLPTTGQAEAVGGGGRHRHRCVRAVRTAPSAPRRDAARPWVDCRSPEPRRCPPGSPPRRSRACTCRSMSAPLTPPTRRGRCRTPRPDHQGRPRSATRHTTRGPRRHRRNDRRSHRHRRTTGTATNTDALASMGWTSVPRPMRKLTALRASAHRRTDVTRQEAAARTSSRMMAAFSSSVFSASANSPTRICRALASIRFSPADRPRS